MRRYKKLIFILFLITICVVSIHILNRPSENANSKHHKRSYFKPEKKENLTKKKKRIDTENENILVEKSVQELLKVLETKILSTWDIDEFVNELDKLRTEVINKNEIAIDLLIEKLMDENTPTEVRVFIASILGWEKYHPKIKKTFIDIFRNDNDGFVLAVCAKSLALTNEGYDSEYWSYFFLHFIDKNWRYQYLIKWDSKEPLIKISKYNEKPINDREYVIELLELVRRIRIEEPTNSEFLNYGDAYNSIDWTERDLYDLFKFYFIRDRSFGILNDFVNAAGSEYDFEFAASFFDLTQNTKEIFRMIRLVESEISFSQPRTKPLRDKLYEIYFKYKYDDDIKVLIAAMASGGIHIGEDDGISIMQDYISTTKDRKKVQNYIDHFKEFIINEWGSCKFTHPAKKGLFFVENFYPDLNIDEKKKFLDCVKQHLEMSKHTLKEDKCIPSEALEKILQIEEDPEIRQIAIEYYNQAK